MKPPSSADVPRQGADERQRNRRSQEKRIWEVAAFVAFFGAVIVASTLPLRQFIVRRELGNALDRTDLSQVGKTLNQGAPINTRGSLGDTPLSLAVARGDRKLTAELIARHADVNLPSRQVGTPLMWAMYRGDPVIIDALLRAGADVNFMNKDGESAQKLAVVYRQPAALRRLIQAGADVNIRDNLGRTPLSYAADEGDQECTRILKHAGAHR